MKDIEKDDEISFVNLHLYEIWTLLGSLTHLLQFAIMHTIKAPQSGFQSSIQHFSVNLVLGKFLITGTSQKMCEPATMTTMTKMRIGNDDHGIGVDPDGIGVYGFPGQAGPQFLTSTDVRVGVHSPPASAAAAAKARPRVGPGHNSGPSWTVRPTLPLPERSTNGERESKLRRRA